MIEYPGAHTMHTHMKAPWLSQGNSLKCAHCCGTVPLLLYGCGWTAVCTAVAARVLWNSEASGVEIVQIVFLGMAYTRAHAHTDRSNVCGCHKGKHI